MKKCIALFSLLLLLFMLTACVSKQNYETQVQFYYRTQKVIHGAEDGLISSELRSITDATDIPALLLLYFTGPVEESLASPFPSGLELKNISFDTDKAEIVLSDHITELSGSDTIIACACLLKTLSELTGIQEIRISAENEMINGQDVITMNANNILLLDSETLNPGLKNN